MRVTRRRVFLCIVAIIVAAAVVFGTRARLTAQTTGGTRFQPAQLPRRPASVRPRAVDDRPVTVVAILSGDAVAVAQEAAGRRLTRDEKNAIKARRAAEQAAVVGSIASVGGVTVNQFQSALNGIKVRITRSRIDALRQLPGVVDVKHVATFKPTNVVSVPRIGAPLAWAGVLGVRGEGIKVGIIDTGIDYTHANFGGPGTVAAYQAAFATDTAPADPTMFGPSAPKVKGGTDLVGDQYDPESADPAKNTPRPDPNPLDCNGHGSHVAGTAAGFGVLSNGGTYHGPYDQTTHTGNQFLVGPGVAPKADLYAIRVFGCEGSTDVVVDAIEWAVDHDMDVINMSLGSTWGTKDSPDAVAVNNASRDGVIVVSSSGNEGHAPYMTGSPGTGTRGISTAAVDPTASFPGATIHLSTGTNIQAIDANGAPLPSGSFPVKVIYADPPANTRISLGCDPAEDAAQGAAGKFIVVARGTCARVAKAIFGQQAGALGVIMVNNSAGFPPFEGKITSNPDTGEQFTVTIPFLGVPGGANPSTSPNGAALRAADGGSLTLDPLSIANPTFRALADFSSFGPRTGDSWLKPDVSAPGVSIASVGMGTGTGAAIISGTSMASPHAAGTAALVKQAHPKWKKVEYWKAAEVNTANPGGVTGYSTRGAGTGLIQAYDATHTDVIALGDPGTATLNFGMKEIDKDFVSERVLISVINFGSKKATFNIAATLPQGSPHSIALSRSSVTVQGGGNGADIGVRLTVPVATAGDSAAFHDVAGVITLTPASSSDNNGITLRVPYYLVPQAVSHVAIGSGVGDAGDKLTAGDNPVTLTNKKGAATGTADWYAWGLKEGRSKGLGSDDLVSAGVQSYPSDEIAVFSLSTARPWSNPTENEFDVFVDVNADGTPDYLVAAVDFGLVTAGDPNGQPVVAVFALKTGDGSIDFLTGANFNGNSMFLPVLFEQLCVTGNPCISSGTPITYTAASFSQNDGTSDDFGAQSASYDLFHPAFTTSSGGFDVIPPNATVNDTVSIDGAQWNTVNPLGLLVLSQNNPSRTGRSDADQGGDSEAMTLKVKIPKK
jgi:minor extracellular serine protease Vpr